MNDESRTQRLHEIRERLQSADALRALAVFEARCGRFGDTERRTAPVDELEQRDSGNPDVSYTVKGHAAVYDRKSLDLGGFQEIIEAAAFTPVLDRDPHVLLLRDHQPGTELASTRSQKYLLELREDPKGLHFYAKVAPTSTAQDLRVLMEGGVVNQASFAFTVERDTWEIRNEGKDNELVIRTIHEIGDLYDVTITAMGAYPQTDSSVVRSVALAYAIDTGRLSDPPSEDTDDEDPPQEERTEPEPELVEERGAISEDVAPDEPVDAEETPSPAENGEGGASHVHPVLRAARFMSRQEVDRHRFLLEEHK